MVFAGPIFSDHGFLEPYGSRWTEEEWTRRVKNGTAPAPPPWTQSDLLRKPTPWLDGLAVLGDPPHQYP